MSVNADTTAAPIAAPVLASDCGGGVDEGGGSGVEVAVVGAVGVATVVEGGPVGVVEVVVVEVGALVVDGEACVVLAADEVGVVVEVGLLIGGGGDGDGNVSLGEFTATAEPLALLVGISPVTPSPLTEAMFSMVPVASRSIRVRITTILDWPTARSPA